MTEPDLPQMEAVNADRRDKRANITMRIGIVAVAVVLLALITWGFVTSMASGRNDHAERALCIEQGGIWANGTCGWSR